MVGRPPTYDVYGHKKTGQAMAQEWPIRNKEDLLAHAIAIER
jgi:hypothetical protein